MIDQAREREAVVVVDLGFGDAGKGLVTDFLVRRRGARTVVRFNGGAQAGHNVVTLDGRHHTFAQLGAGTFVPGVRTHLSRHMIVHPLALLVEARRLAACGVLDALDRLTISEESLVIAPFQQAACRLREIARGDARHGSCGVGVGEAVKDALEAPREAIRMRHLRDTTALRRSLAALQERKRAELAAVLRSLPQTSAAQVERRVLEDPSIVEAWIDAVAPLRARESLVVPDGHLGRILRDPGSVIFEGAQGVLLDEWRGFHPHTTWSTCTPENALTLLAEHGYEGRITRLGVLRAYATRHGAGPLPTESFDLGAELAEPHNTLDPWQGAFRVGYPDPLLARYAIAVSGGVDALAVTHLDALGRTGGWKTCRAYRPRGVDVDERLFDRAVGGDIAGIRLGPARDLVHQEALGRALFEIDPVYEPLGIAGGAAGEAGFVDWVEGALGAPVRLVSRGPCADDVSVRPWGAARDAWRCAPP